MNHFKVTMPNGIIIESWDDVVVPVKAPAKQSLALPKEPKAPSIKTQPKAADTVKPKKVVKPSKKAPVKKPKASKQESDKVTLLAEIRRLTAEGKFSEAVKLTPKGWIQEIALIQRKAEMGGTTYNAAANAAGKKGTPTRKGRGKRKAASKKLQKVGEKAEGLVGALDMVPDTGSIKQAPLEPAVEKAVHTKVSLRDALADIGVTGFVSDVLTGDFSLKAAKECYLSASADEVLILMDACKQEALLLEDGAERCEAAGPEFARQAEMLNQMVELWKMFAAKLRSKAEALTTA
jgi:hypothetical protein